MLRGGTPAGPATVQPSAARSGRVPAALAVLWIALDTMSAPPVERPEVFRDEIPWSVSAAVTLDLYLDLASPTRWEQAYDEAKLGSWGNLNPPVGKALLGLGLIGEASTRELQPRVWSDWAEGDSNERGRAALTAARRSVVVQGRALLLLCFALAWVVSGNGWASLLALVALTSDPSLEFLMTSAMTDVPMLLLASLAVAATVRYASRRSIFALACASIAVGLACATKLSAGAFAIGTVCVVLSPGIQVRRRLLHVTLVGALSLGAFIAVNPYLYPAPVERMDKMVAGWSEVKAHQRSDSTDAVDSPLEGLWHVTVRGVVAPYNRRHLSSRALWRSQRAAVLWIAGALGAMALMLAGPRPRRRLGWRGWGLVAATVLALTFPSLALGGPWPAPLLSVAGWIGLVRRIGLEGVRSRAGAYAVIYACTWVVAGLWLPLTWARYFVPVALLAMLSWPVGLCWLQDQIALPAGWQNTATGRAARLLGAAACVVAALALLVPPQ
jgi:hypothetical protein